LITAIEGMEPRHYLSASYYERSLTGFATVCIEKGVVSREDFERLAEGSFWLSLPSAEGRHNAAVRDSLEIGDKVRVKNDFVSGHVRMPGYIRMKIGIVVTAPPRYPFPDAAAHNLQAPRSRAIWKKRPDRRRERVCREKDPHHRYRGGKPGIRHGSGGQGTQPSRCFLHP
jgi:Nitrile hydratase beta subunit